MIKKSILLISLLLFFLPACEQIADVDRDNDVSIATADEDPEHVRAAAASSITLKDSYFLDCSTTFNLDFRTFEILYNANGADSGTVPIDKTKYYKGEIVTVADSNTLVKKGYIFDGWCKNPYRTGNTYKPGDTFAMGCSTITLHAKWREKKTFSLTFGGSNWDEANSIQQTSDGGYIVAGISGSDDGDITGNHGSEDAWILKLNARGDIQWSKLFGGQNSDYAQSIQQTTDGGFIVAGYSESIDGDVTGNYISREAWILKLNAQGDIQWSKLFGGWENDEALSIQQTSDGGFIVAGYSESNDGNVPGNHGWDDAWILKLNAQGNIQWSKVFGGSSHDYAKSIQQTSDGGFIVAGCSLSDNGDVTGNHGYRDAWVLKLNAQGDIQWSKLFGGWKDDDVQSIQQTSDGGFIVAGYSRSNHGDVPGNYGIDDAWILKLNSLGNMEWSKVFGGSRNDNAQSIQQTSDGGFIVAGYSWSNNEDVTDNHGASDAWILKLNVQGDIQWSKLFGGSSVDQAHSILQTNDGGFIVAGYSDSNNGDVTGNHGSRDAWILKLDKNGNLK